MQNNKTNFLLPLIIISNLFPLYGVLKFNWTIFSVVYIYWLELIIISTFDILKILFSQGDKKASFFSKTGLSFKLFLFRTFIFFFYLLFIVVFLGMVVSGNKKGSGIGIFETIVLKDMFFRVVLLNFFVYNLVEFIVAFVMMKEYKTSLPNDHFIIFDSHMIVVHVVVVLGTFLYEFVIKKIELDHKAAMVSCVCLFIFIKILVDIGRQNMSGKIPVEATGKYI